MHLTRLLRNQPTTLTHLIDHYAKYPPTGLTMKKIVQFGLFAFLSFIDHQLPICSSGR